VTDWQQKQFKWWLAQLQWALVRGWNITESETLLTYQFQWDHLAINVQNVSMMYSRY